MVGVEEVGPWDETKKQTENLPVNLPLLLTLSPTQISFRHCFCRKIESRYCLIPLISIFLILTSRTTWGDLHPAPLHNIPRPTCPCPRMRSAIFLVIMVSIRSFRSLAYVAPLSRISVVGGFRFTPPTLRASRTRGNIAGAGSGAQCAGGGVRALALSHIDHQSVTRSLTTTSLSLSASASASASADQKDKQSTSTSNEAASITPRSVDYSQWYLDVISSSQLSQSSPTRGCMIIRPYGNKIWEFMRGDMDRRLGGKGVENCYFPMMIPLEFLESEAEVRRIEE